MKKIKKILCLCFALFALAMPLVFTGCDLNAGNDDKKGNVQPHIEVTGVPTAYFVGDEFPYNNALIKYYASKDATEYTAYRLKAENLIGFSTETAGTFEATVLYDDLHFEFEYKVYRVQNVVNKVFNESIGAGSLKFSQGRSFTVVTENGLYQELIGSENINKSWSIIENDHFYTYNLQLNKDTNEVQSATKSLLTGERYNSVTNFLNWFWDQFTFLNIDDTIVFNSNFKNGSGIISVSSQNNDNLTQITLDNWKVISLNTGDIDTYTIEYDASFTIPAMPNIAWIEE
ncbi:MAG: hypothetical protein IJS74_00230 [Clostridia bacterium]|nr:hypothetical protein [Clostridia bacterium]